MRWWGSLREAGLFADSGKPVNTDFQPPNKLKTRLAQGFPVARSEPSRDTKFITQRHKAAKETNHGELNSSRLCAFARYLSFVSLVDRSTQLGGRWFCRAQMREPGNACVQRSKRDPQILQILADFFCRREGLSL
jgi:hypothetical protein